MSNPNKETQRSGSEGRVTEPTLPTQSEVLAVCAMLETALNELAFAQLTLDSDYFLCSPTPETDAALCRIRSARQKCGKLADQLCQMYPTTQAETNARYNAMNAYLAQVDVDRMPCHPEGQITSRNDRESDLEAAWLGAASEHRLAINVRPWKGWPGKNSSFKGR